MVALKLSHINELQWFSKKAINYYELLAINNDLKDKDKCKYLLKIHYETWDNLGAFIEMIAPKKEDTQNIPTFIKYAMIYISGGKGDWKKQASKDYFLTSMQGVPFYSDTLGQLPFAINIYKGFCALLQHINPHLDYETQIKPKAKNATINIGYAFSSGGLKGFLISYQKGFYDFTTLCKQEQYPPFDYKSYDNVMILRGIAWVDKYNKKAYYDKLAKELENDINL